MSDVAFFVVNGIWIGLLVLTAIEEARQRSASGSSDDTPREEPANGLTLMRRSNVSDEKVNWRGHPYASDESDGWAFVVMLAYGFMGVIVVAGVLVAVAYS